MKNKIIILTILSSLTIFSQTNNIEKIFEQIKNKLDKVNDYSAEVNIAVNMDFLKMPKSKAEIFFKKPDKFKMKSSSFAILPKAGIDFNPQRILDYDFSSEFVGDTLVDESKVSLYKITPNTDTLKFVSAVLAIDETEMLIRQLILTSDNNAKVITSFSYDKQKEFALPSELKVYFDFSEVEGDPTKKRRNRNIPENFKGEITITYRDYKINQGIDDAIFIEEEENFEEEKKVNK